MQVDPTLGIPLDFPGYATARAADFAEHVIDGVPDYAFSLDWKIRRNLDRLTPLRKLAEALTAGTVPVQRALFESKAVAVSPTQLPRVHAMGVQCAETLGIGVPQLFVMQNPLMNAFTFATGEVDQIVVLTSGLVEAIDDAELLTVIGHECGHIHNRHVVYNTLWEVLTNDLARGLLRTVLARLTRSSLVLALIDLAFRGATSMLFMRWHRCAEITCDRAGLLCSGDPDAARRLPGKLAMGHVGNLEGFSADAYADQMKTWRKSSLKWAELAHSHPLGPIRTRSVDAFLDCEVLHRWRPELQTPTARSKAEVDAEIEGIFL
jgi:Zn-dependent protease with chaperone function